MCIYISLSLSLLSIILLHDKQSPSPANLAARLSFDTKARHMIQAAGVDTWFLKLPSGEWEEAGSTET